MGEDCGQIAERITEKDLVTPKWFDRFCINHIDIAANLVANVYVDGELHQEIAHLTPADAKYVKITAERNGHPVAFLLPAELRDSCLVTCLIIAS